MGLLIWNVMWMLMMNLSGICSDCFSKGCCFYISSVNVFIFSNFYGGEIHITYHLNYF